jgi:hypothetical protein
MRKAKPTGYSTMKYPLCIAAAGLGLIMALVVYRNEDGIIQGTIAHIDY